MARKILGWFLIGFVILTIYAVTAATVALGGSAIAAGLLFLGAWLIWS
jgi:hypothetical protein